jgi:hypothetical protein
VLACEAVPTPLELGSVVLGPAQNGARAIETPRSAIISARSRYESLYWRYQRTHSTMISASKRRPLKSSSTLSSLLAGPKYEGLSNFCLNAARFATEPAAEGSVFSPERIGVWPPLALRRWLDETAAIYAGIAEKMAPPEAVKA